MNLHTLEPVQWIERAWSQLEDILRLLENCFKNALNLLYYIFTDFVNSRLFQRLVHWVLHTVVWYTTNGVVGPWMTRGVSPSCRRVIKRHEKSLQMFYVNTSLSRLQNSVVDTVENSRKFPWDKARGKDVFTYVTIVCVSDFKYG